MRAARPHEDHAGGGGVRSNLVATAKADRLHFTGDDEADAFLAAEPLALLVGFVLDQQVPVQRAFAAPLELKRRLGSFDAATIAETDPAELERLFRERPALHRFPAAMARRTQALAAAIQEHYGGQAERVWSEAADGRELERRLLELPGIGDMKAKTLIAVIGKRLDVRPPGWEEVAPAQPTLGDVDSVEALERYQAGKRARRAEIRAGLT